jgi:single-strand DNA-binding protein
MNKIALYGRITKSPELRRTQSGVAVTSFTLAVDRDFKDKNTGEKQTDFINCVAWRNTGKFVAKYFDKGYPLLLEGSLQIRNYEDKQGNKRTAAEVIVDHVEFTHGKPQDAGSNTEAPAPKPRDQFAELDADDGELPF